MPLVVDISVVFVNFSQAARFLRPIRRALLMLELMPGM